MITMESIYEELRPVLRPRWIAEIRERGSKEDNAQLDYWLQQEENTGVTIPYILLMRLRSSWCREHTKACMTPTILKNWKDSMPPAVAVYFFHQCDVHAIEDSYFYDFSQSYVEEVLLNEEKKGLVATCYAYLDVTGESSRHGTWYQGKRVWDDLSIQRQRKYTHVAKFLHGLCVSKKVVTDDHFNNKWRLEISKKYKWTKDVEALAFTGEGREKFLG